MIGAFMQEFSGDEAKPVFGNVTAKETQWSHELFTAALESYKTGRRIMLSDGK